MLCFRSRVIVTSYVYSDFSKEKSARKAAIKRKSLCRIWQVYFKVSSTLTDRPMTNHLLEDKFKRVSMLFDSSKGLSITVLWSVITWPFARWNTWERPLDWNQLTETKYVQLTMDSLIHYWNFSWMNERTTVSCAYIASRLTITIYRFNN